MYECRYTNCFRGSVSTTQHAEQVMMSDDELATHLRAEPVQSQCRVQSDESVERPRLELTMYLTQQPCHFASGRVENASVTGTTSCTLELLQWMERCAPGARARCPDTDCVPTPSAQRSDCEGLRETERGFERRETCVEGHTALDARAARNHSAVASADGLWRLGPWQAGDAHAGGRDALRGRRGYGVSLTLGECTHIDAHDR